MIRSSRAKWLGTAVGLVLGAWGTPHARADSFYTIRSLNTPIADFVTTGDGVSINVTASSNAEVQRTGLTLNGRDVTAALRPDGAAGSLTGTVHGLQVGANTLRLFKKKGSQAVV